MYTPEAKKPLFERIQERLAASRFLTFSALLHAIIIFLGGGVVLYKQATDTPDFAASGGDLVASDTQVQAPPEQPPDLTQQEFTPQTPQLNAPSLSAITTNNVTTPTFQVASAVPVMSAPTNDMTKAIQSASKAIGKGSSGIPGTMASRVGGTARAAAMQMNGGKKESEEAVMKGLRWLVKTQNPDGSWGKGGGPIQAAFTGFSILSFLGHGETPVSAEFGPTVQKALDWVMKNGAANDGRLSMEKAFSQPGCYAHGIVTYALGEYYTMTKDERVADLLKKAVGYVVEGQGPDGGWMYSYDKSTPSDTSVSGWQIQALKAAHLSGLDIAGVDAALDKAMVNLERVRGKNGGYGYRTKEQEKYSLTGVGVLCTYFWKQEKDKSVREGIEYIMDHTKKDFPVEYKGDKADLYAWYYNTQACLMVGGAAWNTWNRLFQGELVKNQSPDGSWPPMAGQAVGEFQRNVEGNGPFYRTNFCILMLEVYYRYMPTTK
ncbi:MAG: terpene cyclase/mutase family protein [Chthoniobacter sp.]|nr:terpene cyclase/mutase family protein [Chthoniobacter sp.]